MSAMISLSLRGKILNRHYTSQNDIVVYVDMVR
jgi:hypothetical protein